MFGVGFTSGAKITLTLVGEGIPVMVAGAGSVDGTPSFVVLPDGSFYCKVRVPFDDDVTRWHGLKTWLAWEMVPADGQDTRSGRYARASFFVPHRDIDQYPPDGALPGAPLTINGSGWGVRNFGNVSSHVTLTVYANVETLDVVATYGPYEVDEFGAFTAEIIVPRGDDTIPSFSVRATDNNGPAADGGTGGFSANQTTSRALLQPTGVVEVMPDGNAGIGARAIVTGSGFPANTIVHLFFGSPHTRVLPEPVTDETGSFIESLRVPSCGGTWWPRTDVWGHLCFPYYLVVARVGHVTGAKEFSLPFQAISISRDAVRPGDTVTLTGTSFPAGEPVSHINFGKEAASLPMPDPVIDARGGVSAEVVVPEVPPGEYIVELRTRTVSAQTTVRVIRGGCNASEHAAITVKPHGGVPGQTVVVHGSGFVPGTSISLGLANSPVPIEVGRAINLPVMVGEVIVDPDGTFSYEGTVPFDDEVTGSYGRWSGQKTWTAVDDCGRGTSAMGFEIWEPRLTLFPRVAERGAEVEVSGYGWGHKTRGAIASQVTLTLSTDTNATFGPFAINAYGEFSGAIRVPPDGTVTEITVTATDNNGPGGTGGFASHQTAQSTLKLTVDNALRTALLEEICRGSSAALPCA